MRGIETQLIHTLNQINYILYYFWISPFYFLGFGIGPYLLGALVSVIGYRGLYGAMAVVILSSIIIYHFVQGRKENSTKLFSDEEIYE